MAERHFLFVQAPFGRFSRRLAERLRADGHRVSRVILNGGDLFNWGFANAHFFLAPVGRYRGWIRRLMAREGITDIITYGDGHFYTEVAAEEARDAGITVSCLEQGYLRPNWITLELGGVNGHSHLPKDPEVYRRLGQPLDELPGAHEVLGTVTLNNTMNIVVYSFIFYFLAPFFPFYRSPVYMPVVVTGLAHLWRYYYSKLLVEKVRRQEEAILGMAQPYYLALNQRPGDSQIVRHSDLPQVRHFYRKVIESFAKHAPKDHQLVIKGHPLDQGFSHHASGIDRAAKRCGVRDRVHFLDGGHLANLVRRSVGVVTVNSTAGLAALNFTAKAKTLGDAVYDIPGLTYQGDLDSFWTADSKPDHELFLRYRQLMAEMTQVLGSFSTERGIELAVETCARRLVSQPPMLETLCGCQRATAI